MSIEEMFVPLGRVSFWQEGALWARGGNHYDDYQFPDLFPHYDRESVYRSFLNGWRFATLQMAQERKTT